MYTDFIETVLDSFANDFLEREYIMNNSRADNNSKVLKVTLRVITHEMPKRYKNWMSNRNVMRPFFLT